MLRVIFPALFLFLLLMSTPPLPGDDRVGQARIRQQEWISARFQSLGVDYPPARLYLEGRKTEGELLLYAGNHGDTPMRLIHRFAVLGQSGGLGPKRREGDLQVPEGCYTIDRFNPKSRFHLSLGLNYPNAADLHFADPAQPGSDIFLHGGALTVGCLPLGDPGIERLYLICHDHHAASRRPIAVHLFPCAMDATQWASVLEPALAVAENPAPLRRLWRSLTSIWESFHTTQRVPNWELDSEGFYRLTE